MWAYIGIWHDRVGVYFKTPEKPFDQAVVRLDPATREVYLIYDTRYPDFQFRVMKDSSESGIAAGYTWKFEDKNVDRTGFARCRVHPVFMIPQTGGYGGKLAPNYELPWPHARDCEQYLRVDELMHECQVRKASALLAGVRMPAPPPHIQAILTPAMRVELFG